MDLVAQPQSPMATCPRSRILAAASHGSGSFGSSAISLPAQGALPAAWVDRTEPQLRRRIKAGDLSLELRRYPGQRGVQVKVRQTEILFVVPLHGEGEILGDGFAKKLECDEGVFLARPGVTTIIWHTGALVATVHIPRQKVQALASARTGIPLRIIGGDALILSRTAMDGFRPAQEALLEDIQRQGEMPGDAAAQRFLAAWIGVMTAEPYAGKIFTVARSVKAAMDHIAADTCSPCDHDTLARIAAVTPRTLRRGFLSCLGVSLSAYVQQVRLQMIRDLLASGRESRTITELAQAAGFASPTGFTRSYSRMFDETPTRTRVRAVQNGSAD